jgi:hypothetical protein
MQLHFLHCGNSAADMQLCWTAGPSKFHLIQRRHVAAMSIPVPHRWQQRLLQQRRPLLPLPQQQVPAI